LLDLLSGDAEALPQRILQGIGVRIRGDEHPSADWLPVLVSFEGGAILADKLLETHSTQLGEGRAAGLRDNGGKAGDMVERRSHDLSLKLRRAQHILQHRSGERHAGDGRRQAELGHTHAA
jgi:hypothetical protein